MEELIGKFAYKKRGYFSGLIGKIEKNDGFTPYRLVTKSGIKIVFTKISEIELVEIKEN